MSQILKILTYNIQVAMPSDGIRHYIMHSWHHLFPHPRRNRNLLAIAEVIKPFDIVALQELDAGSIRSRYINQVDFLAEEAAFPFAEQQTTRNFGPFARHSKGLLSRFLIHNANHYVLPSKLPGRGVTTFCIGSKNAPLFIVNVHLSLGPKSQSEQLGFIRDLTEKYEHVIVMGDFNMSPSQLGELDVFKNRLNLAVSDALTYPSWKPKKQLDYILLSHSLKVQKAGVLNLPYSDHLPMFAEIILPNGFEIE
ncbi:MAG: endonuclease/exonuclease/phosphatase family protein [Gammaproteobacteria bacterium]|nr:endonuclease/exonuclease/phosphatase family protein [Gammaproteobacteria bacterium]